MKEELPAEAQEVGRRPVDFYLVYFIFRYIKGRLVLVTHIRDSDLERTVNGIEPQLYSGVLSIPPPNLGQSLIRVFIPDC